MKQTGKIAMILAGAILLLHTFLTHNHHDSVSEEEHMGEYHSATSALDLMRLSLHFNLGQNHLEDYQVKHRLKSNTHRAICSDLTEYSLAFMPVQTSNNLLHPFQCVSQVSSRNISLRGPPPDQG